VAPPAIPQAPAATIYPGTRPGAGRGMEKSDLERWSSIWERLGALDTAGARGGGGCDAAAEERCGYRERRPAREDEDE